MLEKIDLNKKLSKKEYKAQVPKLQRRLYDLETAAWKGGKNSSRMILSEMLPGADSRPPSGCPWTAKCLAQAIT